MIAYFRKTVRNKKLKKLDNFERGCLINVVDPSPEEIKELEQKFNLDEQNLLSAIDKYELPRAEFEKEGSYLILKTINPQDRKEAQTFMVVIGPDYVLTCSKYQPVFLKQMIDKGDHIPTTQKLKVLLFFISQINNEFEKAVLNVVKTVDKTRDSILELKDKDITDLLKKEDALNDFVSAYTYMNRVYERMQKKLNFYEEDKELLEDLVIEGKELLDLCVSSLKTISNIRNHFEILTSNKLNRVITLLTVFTIVISIPAAISGIYGMNISLPVQENPLAFYYIMVFVVSLIAIFMFYLKKKNVI